MEQIPKEVIEMTEDFFAHLSDKDLSIISNQYYQEQKPLQFGFVEGLKFIKDMELARKCARLFMIIYRSYKFYNIQPKEIDAQTVGDTFVAFMESVEENKGILITTRAMCDEMKVLTQQHNLVHFVFIKLFGSDVFPVKIKYEDDSFNSVLALICPILILNNEMKKHFSDEVN